MNVLSFDAVTRYGSVALYSNGDLAESRRWLAHRDHAAQLPVAIQSIMNTFSIPFSQLDFVIVGLGPGSYTGIRIALSLAKGIRSGTGCRVVGVSTLEQLAFACGAWNGTIRPTMPVGEGKLGTALFEGPWSAWKRLTADQTVSLDTQLSDDKKTLIVGPGRSNLRSNDGTLAPPEYDVPDAATLINLALVTGKLSSSVSADLQPNYLRMSTPEERAEVQS